MSDKPNMMGIPYKYSHIILLILLVLSINWVPLLDVHVHLSEGIHANGDHFHPAETPKSHQIVHPRETLDDLTDLHAQAHTHTSETSAVEIDSDAHIQVLVKTINKWLCLLYVLFVLASFYSFLFLPLLRSFHRYTFSNFFKIYPRGPPVDKFERFLG